MSKTAPEQTVTHTPGPWRVHQYDHSRGELWLSIGHHTLDGTSNPSGRWVGPVAELKYLIAHDDEQWANARLIAAAPDLLAACRAALEAYSNLLFEGGQPYDDVCAEIEQAIVKAEGR